MTDWITNENPKFDGEYIVTCRGAEFATSLFYEDGKWVLSGDTNETAVTFDVIAWQPMPEVYREDI